MMKKINIKKIIYSNIITLFFLCIIVTNNFCATKIIRTREIQPGPGTSLLSLIGVTGDSYGGYLIDALTSEYDVYLADYCRAACTLEDNRFLIGECINDRYKYIVLSIGVNEHMKQTPPSIFKSFIENFATIAKLHNKQLIVHTYMTYPTSLYLNFPYKPEDYDNVLKTLSFMIPNLHYIDMSDVNDSIYHQPDGIHYNKLFYNVFIQRLLSFLHDEEIG